VTRNGGCSSKGAEAATVSLSTGMPARQRPGASTAPA
jgi:hypothetical protein